MLNTYKALFTIILKYVAPAWFLFPDTISKTQTVLNTALGSRTHNKASESHLHKPSSFLLTEADLKGIGIEKVLGLDPKGSGVKHNKFLTFCYLFIFFYSEFVTLQ